MIFVLSSPCQHPLLRALACVALVIQPHHKTCLVSESPHLRMRKTPCTRQPISETMRHCLCSSPPRPMSMPEVRCAARAQESGSAFPPVLLDTFPAPSTWSSFHVERATGWFDPPALCCAQRRPNDCQGPAGRQGRGECHRQGVPRAMPPSA